MSHNWCSISLQSPAGQNPAPIESMESGGFLLGPHWAGLEGGWEGVACIRGGADL